VPGRETFTHAAQRVVGRHAGRPTRFHTARGDLMPADAWQGLPRLVAKRIQGRRHPHPWMVWGAVVVLDDSLTPESRVLELGSGDSTAWYARRAGSVLSLEDNASWAGEVAADLRVAGLLYAEVRHVATEELGPILESLPRAGFDVVIVDNDDRPTFTRNDAVAIARDLVRPGGLLVLDDSDHPRWVAANETLADWDVQRFVGMKPWPLMATETAVFTRPADS
jgi:SAM-dependent methyltransferase